MLDKITHMVNDKESLMMITEWNKLLKQSTGDFIENFFFNPVRKNSFQEKDNDEDD